MQAKPIYIQIGSTKKSQLQGWFNTTKREIDIAKPWTGQSNIIDAIFLEHVLEHITHATAYGFMIDAYNKLKPGGYIRIAVPDPLHIRTNANEAYEKFCMEKTGVDPMSAIILCWGHVSVWTPDLLIGFLKNIGYVEIQEFAPGDSDVEHLRGVESHWKEIGEEFNRIETICVQARKPLPVIENVQKEEIKIDE